MDTKIVAIAALCILEGIALIMEVDGVYLLPVVAIIAGLGGYQIQNLKLHRQMEVMKQNGNGRNR